MIPIIFAAVILIILGSVIPGSGREEERMKDEISLLCSEIEGVGECRVTVTYGKMGEVYAVAVLCEGAEDLSVRASLVDFFSSLYGIGANRITVLKIKNKN